MGSVYVYILHVKMSFKKNIVYEIYFVGNTYIIHFVNRA